jgi:tRNA(adenine34) deaminase
MRVALAEARLGQEAGEVPVGAVLVVSGEIIAQAHNAPIRLSDPTAHAEMIVLREAASRIGNYRLTEAALYVTLEPCVMCAGAIVHARIARLVFGCRDLRFGGVRSKFRIADSELLNHRVDISEGTRADECQQLITEFFRTRR